MPLATRRGRHGYRRITALLRDAGWTVNVKRVERIWRRPTPAQERAFPSGPEKRSAFLAEGSCATTEEAQTWLADGSRVRLRPERPDHVWSHDFAGARAHDGRKLRVLNVEPKGLPDVVGEFTRECPAIRVGCELKAADVIGVFSDPFIPRGVSGHMRSGNGPERVAKVGQKWITAVGAKTAHIEPASPWGETRPWSTQWVDHGVERACRELQPEAA